MEEQSKKEKGLTDTDSSLVIAAQGGGIRVLSGNGKITIEIFFNIKERYQNLECGRGENN